MRRCFHVLHTTSLPPGSPSLAAQQNRGPEALSNFLVWTTRRSYSQDLSTNTITDRHDIHRGARNETSQPGSDFREDPYASCERRRHTFSMALQTLQAMTPRAMLTARPTTLQSCLNRKNETANPTNLGEDTSRSRCALKRYNPQFWDRLKDLTKSKAKCSTVNTTRLKDLFDDPHNARDLNIEAYTIVVAFCVRTNDFGLLRHFMRHAQKSQVVPDTILTNTMLGIFVNIPSLTGWSAALQVFATLRLRADTSTWNQLLALSDQRQKQIVFDRMQVLDVPTDTVTLGTLIPLARAHFDSTCSFLASLNYLHWDPRLGDVLVGHLLSLRDSQACIDLLCDPSFPVTIEGYNQVLSHLRKVPAMRVNHQGLARTICRSLFQRGLGPNSDTFLFLFKLAAYIRTKGYGDMIYNAASERGLVSKDLGLARKEQIRQRRRDAVVLKSPPMSWRCWLQSS